MPETSTVGSMMTEQSVIYRRRASACGKQADAEPDFEKMTALLQTALSWIQLAENEEMLAQDPDAGPSEPSC